MIDESELSRLVRNALPPRQAPEALREWARAEARRRERVDAGRSDGGDAVAHAIRSRRGYWVRPSRAAAALFAALALGAVGGVVGYSVTPRSTTAAERQALTAELVDAHLSSLLGDHLMDVRSTDQHTVKPWLAGRVDFAPQVVALDSVGFSLLGARVAYVQGHQAAALVYGRRKHVINVFVWRDDAGSPAGSSPVTQRGYSLVRWSSGGMTYWAVSDAAPAELEAFRAAYLGAMPRPPTRQ